MLATTVFRLSSERSNLHRSVMYVQLWLVSLLQILLITRATGVTPMDPEAETTDCCKDPVDLFEPQCATDRLQKCPPEQSCVFQLQDDIRPAADSPIIPAVAKFQSCAVPSSAQLVCNDTENGPVCQCGIDAKFVKCHPAYFEEELGRPNGFCPILPGFDPNCAHQLPCRYDMILTGNSADYSVEQKCAETSEVDKFDPNSLPLCNWDGIKFVCHCHGVQCLKENLKTLVDRNTMSDRNQTPFDTLSKSSDCCRYPLDLWDPQCPQDRLHNCPSGETCRFRLVDQIVSSGNPVILRAVANFIGCAKPTETNLNCTVGLADSFCHCGIDDKFTKCYPAYFEKELGIPNSFCPVPPESNPNCAHQLPCRYDVTEANLANPAGMKFNLDCSRPSEEFDPNMLATCHYKPKPNGNEIFCSCHGVQCNRPELLKKVAELLKTDPNPLPSLPSTSPETSLPASTSPETSLPASTSPETSLPASTSPETSLPASTSPETSLPASTSPETSLPAPTSPETSSPSPTTSETSPVKTTSTSTSTFPPKGVASASLCECSYEYHTVAYLMALLVFFFVLAYPMAWQIAKVTWAPEDTQFDGDVVAEVDGEDVYADQLNNENLDDEQIGNEDVNDVVDAE